MSQKIIVSFNKNIVEIFQENAIIDSTDPIKMDIYEFRDLLNAVLKAEKPTAYKSSRIWPYNLSYYIIMVPVNNNEYGVINASRTQLEALQIDTGINILDLMITN